MALSYGSPIHAVGSFGVGMFTAGLLLVAVGTPRGYPSPDSVSEGLEMLGVPNRNLRQSADQDWGLGVVLDRHKHTGGGCVSDRCVAVLAG